MKCKLKSFCRLFSEKGRKQSGESPNDPELKSVTYHFQEEVKKELFAICKYLTVAPLGATLA